MSIMRCALPTQSLQLHGRALPIWGGCPYQSVRSSAMASNFPFKQDMLCPLSRGFGSRQGHQEQHDAILLYQPYTCALCTCMCRNWPAHELFPLLVSDSFSMIMTLALHSDGLSLSRVLAQAQLSIV